MPVHERSPESRWLEDNYPFLDDYVGQWIAVLGAGVVDHDADPIELARRVNATYGPGTALFATVVEDVIA